jgi:hypothetical protein
MYIIYLSVIQQLLLYVLSLIVIMIKLNVKCGIYYIPLLTQQETKFFHFHVN